MAWRATFDKGVACFKRGRLDDALAHMNQAAELDSNAFILYDSRAAVHEKLGNLKAALLDAKRVIDLAPNQWQGYARSARLFELVGKHGAAVKMADHALGRLRPEDAPRRAQLVALREKAVVAQAVAETLRTSYLLGKLPVETLVEIFTMLVDEDHAWAAKLSHVCGHWRRILINTPSAWKTLVLSRKHPLRKAKLWKQRAKGRIARLSVSLSELDRAAVFAQLQDLSWEDLRTLCISGEAFVELYRMLADMSLPHTFARLGELALHDCTSSEQLSCCLSGPSWQLGVLRLSGMLNMVDKWWGRIRQLKELHVSGPVDRFSMLVFRANPLLERLVLDCPKMGQVGPDTDSEDGPVSMDHLARIECRGLLDPSRVLGALAAPSVTHLSLSGAAVMADETLLRVACPSLVELDVSNCSVGPTTLPMLLACTPRLERLQIHAVYGVVNAVLQFLTPPEVASLPCRALAHVDVSLCTDLATLSAHAFVRMRAQHVPECAAVASLRMDGCPHVEPEMLPWFRSKVALFSCVYATNKPRRR